MFAYLPDLSPLLFFNLSYECLYFKQHHFDSSHLLPSMSSYLAEEHFAKIFLAWKEEGIFLRVESCSSFSSIDPQDPIQGDSMEFFFNTRWNKENSVITKFCHHFLFFPEGGNEKEKEQGKEITRFRGEDMHRLCDPYDLEIKTDLSKKGCTSDIFIPAKCLYGFDPLSIDTFGFGYAIHRKGKSSLHFPLSSSEISMETHPSFWAQIKMVR
jgi:hypothetical protein